jgi:hypothetical protein
MKKNITLDDKSIEYTLKTSRRARYMRLAIYADGNFVVTVPWGLNEQKIERFIAGKAKWILTKLTSFAAAPKPINNQEVVRNYFQYKNQARQLVRQRIDYYNQIYGVKYNKISIKKQKTIWGSCSRQGNLNFNYRLASLPDRLADYIIVHELCHLKEMNHSPRFWCLVAQTMPDYLERRRELKKIRIFAYE